VLVEKEVLTRLDFVGVIKLFDSFKDKTNLYFCLEYVEGGEFKEYLDLNFKLLNLNIIKFYSAEIALIIEYLHSKGIAHRDLKPENLMMTNTNHLKVIDFGTA